MKLSKMLLCHHFKSMGQYRAEVWTRDDKKKDVCSCIDTKKIFHRTPRDEDGVF